jgi:hypothetical protein
MHTVHGQVQVMVALLDMLKKGPAVEPTKWTASLLSTLCWQENSMKEVMIELRAPAVSVFLGSPSMFQLKCGWETSIFNSVSIT